MLKTLTAAAGGTTLAALLGWFGPSVLDHSADWPASTALKDAQRQALQAQRRDMAAAAICRQQHGEASFTWTADNRLVCIPRRGRTVVSEAQP